MFPMRPNVFLSFFVAVALLVCVGCTETVEPLSKAPSANIKTIQITPSSANISVTQSMQFSALATYTDGTTLDVTSAVAWASSVNAVVLSAPLGLLTCETAGTSQISASMGAHVGVVSMTCAAPQIKEVRLKRLP